MGERCTYVYRYVCIYGKLVRHNKNEVRLHDRYVRRRDARVKERVNDEIPLFLFFLSSLSHHCFDISCTIIFDLLTLSLSSHRKIRIGIFLVVFSFFILK